VAEDEQDGVAQEGSTEDASSAKGGKKRLFLIAGAVLLIGLGAGGFLMMGGGTDDAELAEGEVEAETEADADAEQPAEAHYFSLDPAFVVNFQSEGRRRNGRFLQVTLDAMTRDETVLDGVKRHMPVIRNNLVLLFSRQNYDALMTNEGKEQLRADTLTEIRSILEERIGQAGVEEVYFTSFVMQ
jgi:flagellar FliL protein